LPACLAGERHDAAAASLLPETEVACSINTVVAMRLKLHTQLHARV
jgi:hypothetical protein